MLCKKEMRWEEEAALACMQLLATTEHAPKCPAHGVSFPKSSVYILHAVEKCCCQPYLSQVSWCQNLTRHHLILQREGCSLQKFLELRELYAVVSSLMFKGTRQELKCVLGPHSCGFPSSLLLEHETITLTMIYLFIYLLVCF